MSTTSDEPRLVAAQFTGNEICWCCEQFREESGIVLATGRLLPWWIGLELIDDRGEHTGVELVAFQDRAFFLHGRSSSLGWKLNVRGGDRPPHRLLGRALRSAVDQLGTQPCEPWEVPPSYRKNGKDDPVEADLIRRLRRDWKPPAGENFAIVETHRTLRAQQHGRELNVTKETAAKHHVNASTVKRVRRFYGDL